MNFKKMSQEELVLAAMNMNQELNCYVEYASELDEKKMEIEELRIELAGKDEQIEKLEQHLNEYQFQNWKREMKL
ncbi:hypothetical protein [Macrococcus carouselicus]|uniref:Uncharacterized protein n=1 Tax=Macrococcus carouselicus TaxID=69969 RepID=A0A9Q8CJ03_9STAP|nr:hypothetical protein [Macrococcus carouselicus]TDM04079.1 hypothetical protein ERX40_02610 [Macrococcus carouselicus]